MYSLQHERIVCYGRMAARPQLKLAWSHWILLAILVFAAATRLWRLGFPSVYYFDEVYHVVTAKLIAANDPSAYEWWHSPPEPGTAIDWLHPPLAKLMQASFIVLLGNVSYAWRSSSAIMGTATIGLVYFIGKRLGFSKKTSLLAAFLLSLDGLALVMSRITMNDAHITFFFALSVWSYLGWKKDPTWKHVAFTALSAGLATASKWSGIFVVAFLLFDLVREHTKLSPTYQRSIQTSLQLIVATILTIPVIYLASYGQMFLQGKGFAHLKGLHEQIWWYQTNLKATHPYQSKPLQWILNLRPVYAFTQATATPDTMQNIYLQGNPLFFWSSALAALWIAIDWLLQAWTKLQLLRRTLHEKSKITAESLRASWTKVSAQLPWLDSQMLLLLGYISTWAAWTFSPRIMFFYHYTPAGPFLALMLASLLGPHLEKRGRTRFIAVGLIGLIALTFVVFYPNWTGLEVPVKPFASIYFALTSWR